MFAAWRHTVSLSARCQLRERAHKNIEMALHRWHCDEDTGLLAYLFLQWQVASNSSSSFTSHDADGTGVACCSAFEGTCVMRSRSCVVLRKTPAPPRVARRGIAKSRCAPQPQVVKDAIVLQRASEERRDRARAVVSSQVLRPGGACRSDPQAPVAWIFDVVPALQHREPASTPTGLSNIVP